MIQIEYSTDKAIENAKLQNETMGTLMHCMENIAWRDCNDIETVRGNLNDMLNILYVLMEKQEALDYNLKAVHGQIKVMNALINCKSKQQEAMA